MEKTMLLMGAFLVSFGCTASGPALSPPDVTPSSQAEPPNDSPVIVITQFTLPELSTNELAGSQRQLQITIDDIRGGQVMTSVAWADGFPLVAVRSMRQGDVATFMVADKMYALTLTELRDAFIGDDRATFTFTADKKVLVDIVSGAT